MLRLYVLLAVLLISASLRAQDPRLAEQYYQNGEYEKAATLYESLYKANNSDQYFTRFIECLSGLNKWEECESALQKQIKKEPKKLQLYVTYGNVLEKQGRDAQANEQYRKAIDRLDADRGAISQLANAFNAGSKFDLSIEAYERGSALLKDQNIFALNLAELYRRKDNVPKMMEYYLNALDANPSNLSNIETNLQRNATEDDDMMELQRQLYERLQKNDKGYYYVELLTWVFLQKKDYRNAFRQAKALDRMLDENGGRVFSIAEIAANDKDYDAAIEGYDYIITEKGAASIFYMDSKRNWLGCKRKKIIEGFGYTAADISGLEQAYLGYLTELGRNRNTATLVAELADLYAFYQNNLPQAILLLTEMIDYQGIDKNVQARAKLSLGDMYLMQGEQWESTLLYSQVDKAFKEDVLGSEARFRNAKLSYYSGDFAWAQSQFDVLKSSTSKLISNDAIDMSVFVMDNSADSVTWPLELYALAELLVFQNRFDEAFEKLDSIAVVFPEHSLDDDMMYLKAKIYEKQRSYDKSVTLYQTILDKYADGIRADNSLFRLAELQEQYYKNPDKAKELYEKLFLDFSGSTLAVEARKRYRVLRGDGVQ